jgi:hypothetical protein
MTIEECIEKKVLIEAWNDEKKPCAPTKYLPIGAYGSRVMCVWPGYEKPYLSGQGGPFSTFSHYVLPDKEPAPDIINDNIVLCGVVQKMQHAGMLFMIRYNGGVWESPYCCPLVHGAPEKYEWILLDVATLNMTGAPQKFTRFLI